MAHVYISAEEAVVKFIPEQCYLSQDEHVSHIAQPCHPASINIISMHVNAMYRFHNIMALNTLPIFSSNEKVTSIDEVISQITEFEQQFNKNFQNTFLHMCTCKQHYVAHISSNK